MNRRPDPSEHAPDYRHYIDLVPENDVLSALTAQGEETARLLASVGEEKALFRYGPGKWSIKQVIGHVTDAERVFQYRMAAIARGETKPLPGFDENTYAEGGEFDRVPLADLVDALRTVRQSTLALLRTLPEPAWDRKGLANDNPVTVRALAFGTAGHERHHVRVLRERYLK